MPIYRVKQNIAYWMEVEADNREDAIEQFNTSECDDVTSGDITCVKIRDKPNYE